MGYDVKCEELANAFLEDFRSKEDLHAWRVKQLAQCIQDAIEDWLEEARIEDPTFAEKSL